MPFPSDDTVWPPKHAVPVYEKMAEWSAWYSGDVERIIEVYSGQAASSGGTIPWYRFWNRARAAADGSQRAKLHVPLTSDLAAVSASLLFGEAPRFRIPEAHEPSKPKQKKIVIPDLLRPGEAVEVAPGADPKLDEEGAPAAGDDPDELPSKKETPAQKTEARMLEMIEQGGVVARLLEAAETGAAMGGVYIYPVWDEDLRPFPILAIAQSDQAVPEFRWGILTAVTFHRVVETNGNQVFRHLERHEVEGTGESRQAVVLHRLYRGTEGNLGIPMELSAHDATANLQPRVEIPGVKDLDVEYIPNIRPNRLWRASGYGVADIQGSESLLDALDETWASWIRDIRLAKARIIVPRDYLRTDPDDEDAGPTFDIDQEIYTAMDMEPSLNADARTMLAHQFAIRYNEHRATANAIIERVVSNAGYTPTTLGHMSSDQGSAGSSRTTAAALRVSEHKTILTLRRKGAHWKTALENTVYRMLIIDKEVFGADSEPMRPSIEIADSVIDQPLELAQTTLAMKSAEAASIETRVRTLHPDWSDAEVAAEVDRIDGELEAAKPPPAPAPFGDPSKDPSATGNQPQTDRPGGNGDGGNPPPDAPPFAKRA